MARLFSDAKGSCGSLTDASTVEQSPTAMVIRCVARCNRDGSFPGAARARGVTRTA